MSNQKKCPSCGEWTDWNRLINDTCQFCGAELSPKEKKREEVKRKRIELQDRSYIFNIQEDDSLLVKLSKRIGYFVYLILMAIASFISWLLFWLGP